MCGLFAIQYSHSQKFKAQARQCFDEMASAGITTCGEFHYFHHVSGQTGGDGDDGAGDTPPEEDFSMDAAVIVDPATESRKKFLTAPDF